MGDRIQTEPLPTGSEIRGYDYGTSASAVSPVTLDELHQLEASTGWTEEDAIVLQQYRHIFLDHAERMVDAWRSVIGTQPHLAKWFFGPEGKPDDEYKIKVKARFVQWVRDVPLRSRDRCWLDYH